MNNNTVQAIAATIQAVVQPIAIPVNKFQPFVDIGLMPFIRPCIDVNGIMSPHSTITQEKAGKQPGQYNQQTKQWTGLPKWNSFDATIEDLQHWSTYPGDGVSIVTKQIHAIDVDIDEPKLATQVNNIVTRILGNTATRSRGNSPRVIRPFRLATGETPQKKRVIKFKDGGLIELLGDGQQFVACGTHPSGAYQTFSGDILEVTVQQLNDFWNILKIMFKDSIISSNNGGDSYNGIKQGGEVHYVATDEVTINQANDYINSLPGAKKGGRDEKCYKIATYVRQQYGITAEKCIELLIPWGETCNPSFPKRDVKAKVASAYGGGARSAQGESHPAAIGFGQIALPEGVSAVSVSEIEGELTPVNVKPPSIDTDKPRFLILPNDHYSYADSAKEIFSIIAPTHTLFVNSGGLIVKLSEDNTLIVVTHIMFQSEIESYCGTTMACVKDGANLNLKQKRLSAEKSKTLLESSITSKVLPKIKAISSCSVITTDGAILNQGYHNHNGGILITKGGQVPDVPLNVAIWHLINLHRDFNFTAPSDMSRAIAMMITPAFKHSGLINTVCPVDIGEANDSQSGKTYRQKLVAAIYNNKPSLIAEKKGGVGSLDESISKKIIEGQPFVLLDNLRGRLDSPLFEAIITTPDKAPCRVPHKGEVTIDASLVTFQITSNGVDITRDMANRSCVVRIRKQPNNYQWHDWEGEELLEHVFKYQSYYLGCVFSIAREWIRLGRPEVSIVDHDMRGWAKPMEWIIQNIFKLSPMLEGYSEVKEMVSNPRLGWLRQICLSAQNDNLLNRELYTHDISEIAIDNEIKWPNGRTQYDNNKDATMAVGTFMKKIFNGKDETYIDSFKVTRVCHDKYNQDTRITRNVKSYEISLLAM